MKQKTLLNNEWPVEIYVTLRSKQGSTKGTSKFDALGQILTSETIPTIMKESSFYDL